MTAVLHSVLFSATSKLAVQMQGKHSEYLEERRELWPQVPSVLHIHEEMTLLAVAMAAKRAQHRRLSKRYIHLTASYYEFHLVGHGTINLRLTIS